MQFICLTSDEIWKDRTLGQTEQDSVTHQSCDPLVPNHFDIAPDQLILRSPILIFLFLQINGNGVCYMQASVTKQLSCDDYLSAVVTDRFTLARPTMWQTGSTGMTERSDVWKKCRKGEDCKYNTENYQFYSSGLQASVQGKGNELIQNSSRILRYCHSRRGKVILLLKLLSHFIRLGQWPGPSWFVRMLRWFSVSNSCSHGLRRRAVSVKAI